VALSRQGRLDEAIRHFYEALRLDPDFSGAHNNLGIARARSGVLEGAADHFKAALRIDPGFVHARKNLDKMLARRKNQERQRPPAVKN
jgi:Flp pilus assembly protein TadD